jgi:hypothetical protein
MPTRTGWAERELETGDGRAGLQHPSQLDERGRRVGHVAQEIREREGVEGVVGEGELLGPTGDELHAARSIAALDVLLPVSQHGQGEVTPMTLAGIRSASWRATPAVPVATSRTRAGATETTWSTISRRQRPF